MRQRAYLLLIPVAALLAILPLFVQGPSCGHDFNFHVLSWLEAASQLRHGGYPHWAFTPAWNAGEPRFLFYPPLSWLLGAALGMVLPWVYVPAAFIWCSLTLSGLVFHRFARHYAGKSVATLTTILYLLNPYMLFVAYERTAFAELLAAAFFPLLFAVAFSAEVTVLAVAVPIALLWLTNVPAAIMGSYGLAFLLLCRLVLLTRNGKRLREFLRALGGVALGLALAGVYLVPAVYERRFISPTLALLPGLNPSNHTLFSTMSSGTDADFHNAVVRSASIIAVVLLAISGLALLAVLVRAQAPAGSEWFRPRRFALISAALALLILFLLLPISLPAWRHVPELQFVQFPWRFNALLGTILAVFAMLALRRIGWLNQIHPAATVAASLVLAGALVWPAWTAFQQGCDDDGTVPARVALFHSNLGVEPIDEYTPQSADGDSLEAGDPGYWLLPLSAPIDAKPPSTASPGQAPTPLRLTLPRPELLVLNRRAYPIWQLRLNGHAVDATSQRNDGLMTVALPAGTSTVEIVYHRPWEIVAGVVLSLLALLVAVLAGVRRRRLL